MTEGNHGFLVTLMADVAEEDVEALASAIREMRGVASVRQYTGDLPDAEVAARNDQRWRESIVHLLDDEGV